MTTDAMIERLGADWAVAKTTGRVNGRIIARLEHSMGLVERGEADPGFGLGLSAALDEARRLVGGA